MGAPPPARTHLYGGQAVVEGVMMRGSDHWAVAVREPAGTVYVESHAIDSIAVEVERISEGQRFTTKLLAERIPGESVARPDTR